MSRSRLEPNNVKTMEAINRLENALVAKLENHLELEADDVPESDDEVLFRLFFLFFFFFFGLVWFGLVFFGAVAPSWTGCFIGASRSFLPFSSTANDRGRRDRPDRLGRRQLRRPFFAMRRPPNPFASSQLVPTRPNSSQLVPTRSFCRPIRFFFQS